MFQELIDNITNVGVFTESITNWIQNISINSVIILIMMIFMLVGAIDKIREIKKDTVKNLKRDLTPWDLWLWQWPELLPQRRYWRSS